jgi:Ca2+-binding EF-hand superfamily protein
MVANEHFLEDCELQFTELDQNGDGVLTPDELYPVIKSLLGGHQWTMTLEHCDQFAAVFDENGDGQYLVPVSWVMQTF